MLRGSAQLWLLNAVWNAVRFSSGLAVVRALAVLVLATLSLTAGLPVPVSAAPAIPTTPAGVTAAWVDSFNVGLEWTASTDDEGVLGYKVFRDGVEIGRNPAARTAPFLVAADMSHCDNNARMQGMARVARIFQDNPGRIFLSGDVSQVNGSVNAYDCFHSVYGSEKARMWAVPGNHDYQQAGPQPFFDYFGNQAGHTNLGRFSQKWGPWHVIGINTLCWEIGGCAPGSAQYEWLKSELESSTNACTAIIAHHPRWSTRNPGNAIYLAPMYDLAFKHGVELWFSGDDHFYERYPKLGPSGQPHDRGIRQAIVGVGGFETRGYGPYIAEGPHAEVRHNRSLGAVSVTGRPDSYTMEFLAEAGSRFTDVVDEPCHGGNSGVVAFRDRNRTAGTTHTYRVAAYDADGNVSPLSEPVVVTVGAPPTTQPSPAAPANAAPIGELEHARIEADGTLVATGWALDPDVTDTIKVRLYVDGVWVKQGPALTNRPDIGAAYASHGNNHGFYLRHPLDHQVHEVCARAVDHTGMVSTLLGCLMTDRLPVGEFESVGVDAAGDIVVQGWALDHDLAAAAPTRVHIYLNSQRVRAPLANLTKPYVGLSYPGYGDAHGFWQRLPVSSPGLHQICIWAINNAGVPSTNLGCRTILV